MGYYDEICDECGEYADLVTPLVSLCFSCWDEQ